MTTWPELNIGEWATFTINGDPITGVVVRKTEKYGNTEYTLHQFPDAPQWLTDT